MARGTLTVGDLIRILSGLPTNELVKVDAYGHRYRIDEVYEADGDVVLFAELL